MRHRGAWRVVLLAIVAAGLGACGGDDADALSEKAALGERIFHDRTLSASGKQACSTCHVDAAGHAQDNALAAQLGGAGLDLQGTRVTPSIRYLSDNTAFHFDEEDTPSKYDAHLRGQAVLSTQESRGLALFNDPAKGNCAACHPSERAADGSHPLFTDFSYDNLGVPRNRELVVNADPGYFDLGLCAQPGGQLAARGDLCGAFKVPSLRNVALRQALFHNGHFKTLKDALAFYVQRDTNPEKFYPRRSDGTVDKFDDLPQAYKANVNTSEAPYDRQAGDAPALSDAEIDDVIAFLQTLTDGWGR